VQIKTRQRINRDKYDWCRHPTLHLTFCKGRKFQFYKTNLFESFEDVGCNYHLTIFCARFEHHIKNSLCSINTIFKAQMSDKSFQFFAVTVEKMRSCSPTFLCFNINV
jgi:hypothetical protein